MNYGLAAKEGNTFLFNYLNEIDHDTAIKKMKEYEVFD